MAAFWRPSLRKQRTFREKKKSRQGGIFFHTQKKRKREQSRYSTCQKRLDLQIILISVLSTVPPQTPHLVGCASADMVTFRCRWNVGASQSASEAGDLRLFFKNKYGTDISIHCQGCARLQRTLRQMLQRSHFWTLAQFRLDKNDSMEAAVSFYRETEVQTLHFAPLI